MSIQSFLSNITKRSNLMAVFSYYRNNLFELKKDAFLLFIQNRGRLSLDSKLALREVSKLLLLSDSLLAGLVLGQTATDGAGLLGTEIQGSVLLALVEQTKLVTLGLVDDSQDTGDSLASSTTIIQVSKIHGMGYDTGAQFLHLLESSSSSDLLDTERGKLLLELIELLGKLSLVLVAKFVGFNGDLHVERD
jgi:hypothetical protein